MRIFITGSEGFVGRELVRQALEQNMEVVGCDMVDTASLDYEYHKVRVNSPEMRNIIPDGVDAVIHLAALSNDTQCKGRAYQCFEVNVMGTLNLMDVAAERNAKQFIFASSEWVYESFGVDEEKDEDSPIDLSKHFSEYALTKLVSEANLRQRFAQGFCPVTILRFAIIYGPRKANWSAVESLVSAVRSQDEVVVGSFRTGRRFLHVQDLARGILKSIGLAGFNLINLSADAVLTLRRIIEIAEREFGKSVKKTERDPDNFSVRNPSNGRARVLLNWRPEIDFEKGIKTLLPYV